MPRGASANGLLDDRRLSIAPSSRQIPASEPRKIDAGADGTNAKPRKSRKVGQVRLGWVSCAKDARAIVFTSSFES